jgi:hypothetical protein
VETQEVEGTTVPLPPIEEDMLTEGERLLANLKAGLVKKYERKRPGVHVSDLCNCPRKAAFTDMNEIVVNNRELNFFTSGSAIGEAMEACAREDLENYTTEQYCGLGKISGGSIEVNGVKLPIPDDISFGNLISGHIDIYNKTKNIPTEFKTYRGKTADKLPKLHQVDQLKTYITAMDAEKGLLVYQLLMRFEGSPFEIFEIKMTKEEKQAFAKAKIEDGLRLAIAKARKQPALARHVMNDPNMNWLCVECPFLEACKKLNAGAELQ